MSRPLGSPVLQDLVRGLGWFSVALGVGELFAPRTVAGTIGLRGPASLFRLYGLREIAAGAGILMSDDPAPYVWARAGGDVLDVLTLVAGAARTRRPSALQTALALVLGIAALDFMSGRELDKARVEQKRLGQFDYGDRSGFPRPALEMRGKAREKASA